MSFIFFEYKESPISIVNNLKLIFTIYLALFVIIQVFIYSYKLLFKVSDEIYIHINDLKEWDIINKDYLILTYGDKKILWAHWNKKGYLYPNPKIPLNDVEKPFLKKDVKLIKHVYNIVAESSDEKNINSDKIIILKTFVYWFYIFLGFLLTYFYDDLILKTIIESSINYIYNIK